MAHATNPSTASDSPSGEGPLRIRANAPKISMDAAGADLFKNEPMPDDNQGQLAIGTFLPQYRAQYRGIRSLLMTPN
ncbi:hypothetical protein [Planctellipticum variicoloris]|uniref:hypothetical protein n=1 Tax=Planctellipticum variicoloris TaxID=3064265 RepID=UPI0030140ADE|nr:hypothetical protein SH412_005002 [Planctomycetaceae bacterium SH412]